MDTKCFKMRSLLEIIMFIPFIMILTFSLSDSYVANLVSISKCQKDKWPEANENEKPLKYNCEIYKVGDRRLLRGNISIVGDTNKCVSFITLYSVIDNKRIARVEFSNITCHSPLLKMVFKMFKQLNIDLIYNKVTCAAAKKNYKFEGIDMDKVDHLIRTPWHEPGTIVWQEILICNRKNVACLEFTLEVT